MDFKISDAFYIYSTTTRCVTLHDSDSIFKVYSTL